MAERRGGHALDLGRWLVWLGVLALGGTFWAPWLSASRTARVEDHADQIAELLQRTASVMQPLDLTSPFERAVLLARWLCACTADGLPCHDLELLPATADPGAQVLRAHNVHYLFQLARTPTELHAGTGSLGSIPALETLAWPVSATGPAHSVFYYTEMADAAFTRNLQAGYAGTDADRPLAGAGQRRKDPMFETSGAYRTAVQKVQAGQDDERWLVRWRPLGSPAPRRTRTGNR